jgi:hypothetical protein
VPWRLAAGSPAYQGIANSWNCAAHFEAPRHTVQGLHLHALDRSCWMGAEVACYQGIGSSVPSTLCVASALDGLGNTTLATIVSCQAH